MVGGDDPNPPVVGDRHGDRAPLVPPDPDHRRIQRDRPAQRHHLLRAPLPHHPGAVLRVVELLDQAGHRGLLAAGRQRIEDRLRQRQVLDPLSRPVRLDRARRHPPHLLGVRLEEDRVEPLAEPRGHPALEVRLVRRRAYLRPPVRGHAPDRFAQAQPAQCVQRPQRIVEKLAPVVDPAHPRPAQEILVRQNFVPERLDRPDLGEEPVPTDVEAPPVALHRPADPADDVIGLEHRYRGTGLGEQVRGGQAGRAGADHDS